ncbi:VanZ family protein [Bacillus sp. AFS055030]|uniref:VanZ family protein n=1 Tax=Bacillus sp. AFS055030 TaxID=2033507 RepID=UPI000BFCC794|nr:VanZ family protein [Bacillus sp. AFS055030]PGL71621.1 hypothetical protein CN925_07490 [Bacillus sp. AFS055030]
MKIKLNNLFTFLLSSLFVFFVMRAFLGEFLSRLIPYANVIFGYSLFVCLIFIVNTIVNMIFYYVKYREIHISKSGFGVFTLTYLVMLVSILFSRNSLGNHYSNNYIPFKTIWGYISGKADLIYIISNLVGNIIIFIPLGCIVYYYFHRKMKVSICILVSILLIVLIEFLQKKYVVGSFDIDDIFLNSLGVLLGIKILVGEGNEIAKNLLEKSD